MSTRDSIKDPNINPASVQDRIKYGLEGQNIPADFYLPPGGLEDIDRALFNLYDKDLQFSIDQRGESRKVPVIFATGERFALIKRREPLRDENAALILPLISIR